MRRFFMMAGKLVAFALMLLCCFAVFLFAYTIWFLPDPKVLLDTPMQAPLRIFSSDQQLIAEFGAQRRQTIRYEDIPVSLLNAVLATEDKNFFDNAGVDFRGLARAALVLVTTGSKAQGGSTITMQVARNFFLNKQKTYGRKFKEILLAIKIDYFLTKEDILTLYFNKIFLGKRAYGFAAAADIYYGKPLSELTLAQYAMLAGLPQAPSTANPINNPDRALVRREHVLSRMLSLGFISQAQFHQAMKEPDTASYHELNIPLDAPYVGELVRQIVYQKYGEAIYTDGFEIITTIDSRDQVAANTAVAKGLSAFNARHPKRDDQIQGALIALNPHDGAILAMVGGGDFTKSTFNRATHAKRQVGSAFKPFLFAAALANGMTLATVVNDSPIVIEGTGQDGIWRPQNDEKIFYGPTRLRQGLVKSMNLLSIRVLQQIGIPVALDYMKQFGFALNSLPTTLSLALGTADMTPLMVAQGYAVFANGGYKVQPYVIDRIYDQQHTLLYHHPNTEQIRAITPQIAYLMTSVLQDVIRYGTAKQALDLNRSDIAGKTGTGNEHTDAWFAGYNGDVVAVTWVGYDEPKTTHEYGSQVALPIWIDFMRVALEGTAETEWEQPAGIVTVRIHPQTGLRVPSGETPFIFEQFVAGTEPAYADQAEHHFGGLDDLYS